MIIKRAKTSGIDEYFASMFWLHIIIKIEKWVIFLQLKKKRIITTVFFYKILHRKISTNHKKCLKNLTNTNFSYQINSTNPNNTLKSEEKKPA